MTLREAHIVSAYTKILMSDFSSFHGFVEEVMGRPVWTHEFPSIAEELKEKVKPMFLEICGNLVKDGSEAPKLESKKKVQSEYERITSLPPDEMLRELGIPEVIEVMVSAK